ncbi:hypothetical protein BG95_04565 [Thermosipho sp. 1063]|uniref:sensor domain-containing diguanylate cyclase n=1 Tax=unclassified Thermosipho (in: thermotogales) TaxID=2676525 RepID=UPI00094935F5|nr:MULTISPECIES: GGDEF domain-containing protein [unclassified Thermosipho (in: thermotogales)]ANQ53719.1 diguanylate cyclase [Thermosipho sp. 1070]APT72165.1 hypothetical protein BG95_04565 [Thermosipho sp. 1063]
MIKSYFDLLTSKILLETTVEVLKDESVDKFFHKLADKSLPILKFDAWSVLEVEDKERVKFVAVSDFYQRFDVEKIEKKLSFQDFALYNVVLNTKRWKYIKDVSKTRAWVPNNRISSWIGIPLLFDSKVYGVLSLDYFKIKRLGLKEKLFLDNFQRNFSKIASDFRQLKELFYQKYIDQLTSLKNRHFIEEFFESNKERVGLIFCDLNKFKSINDTYGHRFGDEVIKVVAKRLKNVLKSTDQVVRYGGDEFIIITKNVDKIHVIINRIKNIIKKYDIIIDGKKVNLGISCGYAIFPDDGTDLWEILHIADLRMYEEKKKE